MLKLIFFIIMMMALFDIFNSNLIGDITMVSIAITSLTSAFTLILNIVLVPFGVMLQFYYLKIALYIGFLIFTLSYILKWLTGHHLVSETSEDTQEYDTDVAEKENSYFSARDTYLRTGSNKNYKKMRETKADYLLWKSKYMKDYYKETGKIKTKTKRKIERRKKK